MGTASVAGAKHASGAALRKCEALHHPVETCRVTACKGPALWQVLFRFADGEERRVPGAYIEFAERAPLPEFAYLPVRG